MQPDRFTIKSQEALQAAQQLAGARRNPQVAPVHLLLALLEQEGSIVEPVLKRIGVNPESIRARANAQGVASDVITVEVPAAESLHETLAAKTHVAPKEAVASVTGIGGCAGGLGGFLFSAIIPGFVVTHFGYTPMFVFMGTLHVAALLGMFPILERRGAGE